MSGLRAWSFHAPTLEKIQTNHATSMRDNHGSILWCFFVKTAIADPENTCIRLQIWRWTEKCVARMLGWKKNPSIVRQHWHDNEIIEMKVLGISSFIVDPWTSRPIPAHQSQQVWDLFSCQDWRKSLDRCEEPLALMKSLRQMCIWSGYKEIHSSSVDGLEKRRSWLMQNM